MDDTTSWTTRSKPPPSEREVLNVLHQDLHAAAELARTPPQRLMRLPKRSQPPDLIPTERSASATLLEKCPWPESN